LLFVLVVVVPV